MDRRCDHGSHRDLRLHSSGDNVMESNGLFVMPDRDAMDAALRMLLLGRTASYLLMEGDSGYLEATKDLFSYYSYFLAERDQ